MTRGQEGRQKKLEHRLRLNGASSKPVTALRKSHTENSAAYLKQKIRTAGV